MAKLVVLDAYNGAVITFNVGQPAQDKIEQKYDNDVEAWFCAEGYEDEYKVNLSNCQWLFVENDELIEEHNI